MTIHELTTAECRAVLARAHHGRLACSRDDQPYVVPFFFSLDPDSDCLYSVSRAGQKIRWMRDNPRVCVQVDEVVDRFIWVSVLAFGRYREVHNTAEEADERRRAAELLQHRGSWWLPGLGKLAGGNEPSTAVVYRIQVEKMTGRRGRYPVEGAPKPSA
jgi:nitroimidazol reductase NimA-like FMN-containing flavoprotein (pyridoxamine 5'-phosphate oxidase superfamily)